MILKQNNIFGIILAGGSGSRLWPLSRELCPKQFLSFLDDKTLMQGAYQRLTNFASPENILTITSDKHVLRVKEQITDLNHKVLGEPLARNTAPALALGTYYIQKYLANGEDPVIIVAPSDHLIKDEKAFTKAALEGAEIAKQGFIVTFGIKPSAPETGYGYIKVLPDKKIGKTGLKTDCFKEKPDYNTAVEYLKTGEYFWNSGIFMFSLSTILDEFEKKEPGIIAKIREIDFEEEASVREKYGELPSISIDYAIMEKSDKIALMPAEFDWNDLGSWEAIYAVSQKDEHNNAVKGDVMAIDCKDSLVYSSSRFVSAVGLENIVIVETGNSVLVCDKRDSQRVKEIFDALKKQNSDLYKKYSNLV